MRRIFFKILSKFPYFCPLLNPKRGQSLYLNKSESPSSKHVSHLVWLKLAKWFLRRSRLKEKVNRRIDRTDARQIAMAIAHLSLWLRWANDVHVNIHVLYIKVIIYISKTNLPVSFCHLICWTQTDSTANLSGYKRKDWQNYTVEIFNYCTQRSYLHIYVNTSGFIIKYCKQFTSQMTFQIVTWHLTNLKPGSWKWCMCQPSYDIHV